MIEDIINEFSTTEIMFCLYTNGIILNKIQSNILDNLSHIIISIDGDKEMNDKFRGNGSYEKVMKNVFEFKNKLKGEITARITLTPENYLSKSILNIIDHFDNIFWQIESSPHIENPNTQLHRYSIELDKVLNFYINKLKSGIVYNIIPFQAIITTLLTGKKVDYLRCGCGTSYIYIDTDGNCYSCEELIHYKQFHIGNIFDKRIQSIELNSYNYLIKPCQNCTIRNICGGRCLATYIKYSPEKFSLYCQYTKILTSKIQEMLPELDRLIKQNGIDIKLFNTFMSNHILEGVP